MYHAFIDAVDTAVAAAVDRVVDPAVAVAAPVTIALAPPIADSTGSSCVAVCVTSIHGNKEHDKGCSAKHGKSKKLATERRARTCDDHAKNWHELTDCLVRCHLYTLLAYCRTILKKNVK